MFQSQKWVHPEDPLKPDTFDVIATASELSLISEV